jgi:hypothetical protein
MASWWFKVVRSVRQQTTMAYQSPLSISTRELVELGSSLNLNTDFEPELRENRHARIHPQLLDSPGRIASQMRNGARGITPVAN